jgi:hypothetical protein
VWRATEPHTPSPAARLDAVAELRRRGIESGVLVAPLMPGINDSPEQVARILELATAAGASYITGIALHLRGEVKGLFMQWLKENRPDLLPRYRQLYRRGAYAIPEERQRLARLVKGPDFEPGERMRGRMLDVEPRRPARGRTGGVDARRDGAARRNGFRYDRRAPPDTAENMGGEAARKAEQDAGVAAARDGPNDPLRLF